MKKIIIGLTLLAVTAMGASNIHYESADGSAAIRFKNTGSELVTINIFDAGAAATNTVVIGSTSNTIDGSGAIDTVAEFSAAIAACTNSAGNNVLVMDTDCALSADSTDAELLTGAYTAAAKVGGRETTGELLWDTSVCKFYSAYIADSQVDRKRSDVTVTTLSGNPIGTGDVTAGIYLDGTLVWEMLMPEVYAYSNDTATVALPVDVSIPAGKNAVMVRYSRATTATTGMISINVE